MSAVAGKHHLSAEQYLARKASQADKHEFVGGEVFAMVGATRKHNTIALNIASLLKSRLTGAPCGVFMSDIKLWVAAVDAYFYPNVIVTCNEADLRGELSRTAKRC